MRLSERFNDHQYSLQHVLDGRQAAMWTAMPGHIVSFDANKQTATVQVGVKAHIAQPDNSVQSVTVAVIQDVPVQFPNGGGATLTFPVKAGDQCVIQFFGRNFDSWYQSGGVQEPLDGRMHDLSDATCFVGIRSQTKKLSNFHSSKTQLRADDGQTIIELDHGGKNVNLIVPNVVTIQCPKTHITGDVQVDGQVTVNKTVTANDKITSHVDVLAQTVSLHSHVHINAGGTGTSGPPAA